VNPDATNLNNPKLAGRGVAGQRGKQGLNEYSYSGEEVVRTSKNH
jgi:hypothetical protein